MARRCAWLLVPWLLAGCVVSPERDALPTGVTLLGSGSGECDGAIEVGTDPEVIVASGESTTLAVDAVDLDWACEAGAPQAGGNFSCPDGTTHLRVTRDQGEEEFTLECFG